MKHILLILASTLVASFLTAQDISEWDCINNSEIFLFGGEGASLNAKLDYLESDCKLHFLDYPIVKSVLNLACDQYMSEGAKYNERFLNVIDYYIKVNSDSINFVAARMHLVKGLSNYANDELVSSHSELTKHQLIIQQCLNRNLDTSGFQERDLILSKDLTNYIELSVSNFIKLAHNAKGYEVGAICHYDAGVVNNGNSIWDIVFNNDWRVTGILKILDNSFSISEIDVELVDIKVEVDGNWASYNMLSGEMKSKIENQCAKHIGIRKRTPVSKLLLPK